MLSINKMDYSKLDVNTRCTVQVNYGAVGTLLAYRPSIPRYFTRPSPPFYPLKRL